MCDKGQQYSASFTLSRAGGVRWFDQKVTYDNLAQVASAVLYRDKKKDAFSRSDIQQCLSLNDALTRKYGKPSLTDENAQNEYDKFITQNLNVLAYAGVLSSEMRGGKRLYEVKEPDIIRDIAGDNDRCRIFLIEYIEWALRHFNWWHNIETYSNSEHRQEDMDKLKSQFTTLLINTMSLGKRGSLHPEIEAGRIFPKVINLLAYSLLVPGIKRGRVTNYPPSDFDLIYNRPNWRDSASRKPKQITRYAHKLQIGSLAEHVSRQNSLSKLKDRIRDYQGRNSEVLDSSGAKATNIHHIFPVHSYPTLAETPENMIALTPGQHYNQAHPNGDTGKVDLTFQRVCLAMKLETIKNSVTKADGMYSYKGLARVLEVGWGLSSVSPTYKSLFKAIRDHVD